MKTRLKTYCSLFLLVAIIFYGNLRVVLGQEPIDYVDPYIGSIGHLLTATTPDVQLPRGMVRLIPATTPGIRDVYLADKIYSFSVISLSNDFSKREAAFSLMATTGEISVDADEIASSYDHDQEKATPYYYSVLLEDYNIDVEFTATEHSAFYRFSFPESDSSNLVLNLVEDAEIRLLNKHVIEGYQTYPKNGSQKRKLYFHAEFSKSINAFGCRSGEKIRVGAKEQSVRE